MLSVLSRLRATLRLAPTSQDIQATVEPASSGDSVAHADADAEVREMFDTDWYLKTNGDVAAAGIDPFQHFLAHGEAEGRDPNPRFSLKLYRETYMGSESADASPVRHYIEIGRKLGYDADPVGAPRYRQLIDLQEQSYGLELPEIRRHIAIMTVRPLVVVYSPGADAAGRARVQAALARQAYDRWTLCTEPAEVRDAVAALPAEGWGLVWLEPGDELHPGALYAYVSRLNEQPSASVIYADDDERDARGWRSRPFVKPDWSPDYLESFNYVGSGAYISGSAAAPFADVQGVYDLLLRATEGDAPVEHVRRVLVHREKGLDAAPDAGSIARDRAALQGRLARTGRTGDVSQIRPDVPCYDACVRMRSAPLVSVIIPTAGRTVTIEGREVDLISQCVERLTAVSTYRNIEIIVVHNGDLGEERLGALAARGVTLIAYDGEFNVARKLNIGARQAKGDLLLLLNDDVEPLTPDWIERMAEQFEKPAVGTVGAKLLFPAMVIQHAGVVLVKAKPDHLRFKYPREDLGYFCSTCAVRNFSAVTGAVMMTRASLFREIGGYAEVLPVNFNDVDYCIRATGAGYRTVYTPRAELIHYESMSRAREVKPFEVEGIEDRWRRFVTDPYYNEAMLTSTNLNYDFTGGRDPLG